jgi:hypothetical protein
MTKIMARSLRMRSPGILIAAHCALFCYLMGLASLFALCTHDAAAAQFEIRPSITLSEEYDDNIFLTPNGKKGDFISRIIPAFTLAHSTSFWTWNMEYAYDYRYYANYTVPRDTTYRANVAEHTNLYNNIFLVDVTDIYQRVTLDVTRNYSQESLSYKQSDQNIFAVSPYMNLLSGPSHTVQIGYQYRNSWFKDPAATDTIENAAFLVINTPLSTNLTVTGGIRYTRGLNSLNGYFKTDIVTGPVYTYAPGSSVFCTLGETWLRFVGYKNIHHLLWDLGFTQHYSTMTLRVETKTDYIPDPYNVLRRVDQLEATLTREASSRTSLSGLAGWYEYRSSPTNYLETTAYRVQGSMRHVLTPRSTFSGEISNEVLHDYLLDSDTFIYQIATSFERLMLPDLTLTMNYMYTYAYSPDIYSQNSRDNRFSVQFSKRF